MAASADRTDHFPGGNFNKEQSMVVCVESQEPQWMGDPRAQHNEVLRQHLPNIKGSTPYINSLKVASRELGRNETASRSKLEG